MSREDAIRHYNTETWYANVLAHGSRKSADLAARYLARRQNDQAEACKDREKRVRDSVRQIAHRMFAMTTASELEAPLLEISMLIDQYDEARGADPTSEQLRHFRQLATTWQEFLTHREAGQNSNAIQCLHRLKSHSESVYWLEPEIISTAIQAAIQSIGIPSPDQLKSTIESLAERACSSSKPEDLDGLLLETGKLKSIGEHLPERGTYRIDALEQFIENIQNAHFAREHHDIAKLREYLARIENQEAGELGIARSRILSFAYQLKQSASSAEAISAPPTAPPEEVIVRMTSLEAITPNHTTRQKHTA